MSLTLRLSTAIGRSLLAHLRTAPERVAFLRGVRARDAHTFEVDELLKMTAADLDADPLHVDLTDQARQRVLSWAVTSGDILIEAHSHGRLGDPAGFSFIDLEGLAEWVPHVRWRLGGRPYAALVFGFETFDGLAWVDDGPAVPVSQVKIGGTTLRATGRSSRRLSRPDVV